MWSERAQFEEQFPALGRVFGHLQTLSWRCPHAKYPCRYTLIGRYPFPWKVHHKCWHLVMAMEDVSTHILSVDTSDFKVRRCPKYSSSSCETRDSYRAVQNTTISHLNGRSNIMKTTTFMGDYHDVNTQYNILQNVSCLVESQKYSRQHRNCSASEKDNIPRSTLTLTLQYFNYICTQLVTF